MDELRKFRGKYYFDSLEELMHRSSVLGVHDALFIKVIEAKRKGADVSENEKMLNFLSDAQTFYAALYGELERIKSENFDLRHLNMRLLRDNEALNNTISAINFK